MTNISIQIAMHNFVVKMGKCARKASRGTGQFKQSCPKEVIVSEKEDFQIKVSQMCQCLWTFVLDVLSNWKGHAVGN